MSGCGCCPSLTRRAILTSAAVLPLAGCDAVTLDLLAEILMPEHTASELGLQGFKKATRETRPVMDPGLQDRIAGIAEKIISASETSIQQWYTVVLDSPQINASAFPGGYIVIYNGMLQATANDAQLATIIGHEVGHIDARHGARRMAAEIGVGLMIRLLTDPDNSREILSELSDVVLLRPFSRSNELEADALGLRYMAHAGYDPYEAIHFWETMAALEQGNYTPELLSTHPASEHRVNELKRLVTTLS